MKITLQKVVKPTHTPTRMYDIKVMLKFMFTEMAKIQSQIN